MSIRLAEEDHHPLRSQLEVMFAKVLQGHSVQATANVQGSSPQQSCPHLFCAIIFFK